jgi:hypothetical protein
MSVEFTKIENEDLNAKRPSVLRTTASYIIATGSSFSDSH